MWKGIPKSKVAVRYDRSALFRSPHLVGPFPPKISEEVRQILTQKELDGTQRIIIDITNMMAASMCPDIHEGKLLEKKIDIVSSISLLDAKLPQFVRRAHEASALFIDVFSDHGDSLPKLLVLGTMAGQTFIVRLDRLLVPGYSKWNWFARLPSSLRDFIKDPSVPLVGKGVTRIFNGTGGFTDSSFINVEELLEVLRLHEFFPWASQRIIGQEKLSLPGLCHLIFDHFFGPIGDSNEVIRAHVAKFGNPYQENEWPCWRRCGSLESWGSCLNDFQLTFLYSCVVSSFIPLLLYGVIALCSGGCLVDRSSDASSVLASCAQRLRHPGTAREILSGYSRGVLRLFGPVNLMNPYYQYMVFDQDDFLQVGRSIYSPEDLLHSRISLDTSDMVNKVASSFNKGKTTVGSLADPNHDKEDQLSVFQAAGVGDTTLTLPTNTGAKSFYEYETPVGCKRGGDNLASRQGAKRAREEEDTLELHYESEGEFGDMANGRDPFSGPFADVLTMWKKDPRFIQMGFEEQIEKAPLRFRVSVQMNNACKFCARSAHKSEKNCPQQKRLVTLHGEDSGRWPPQCTYPLCRAPRTHVVQACPTLHSRCGNCQRRGHPLSLCASDMDGSKRLRSIFYQSAPIGKFTSRHVVEPAWGWHYDPTERLKNVIVFQGTKRRRYIEWFKEDGDPKEYKLADLETKANHYYWG